MKNTTLFLTLSILLSSIILHAQNLDTNSKHLKEIKGIITYQEEPLKNVNVLIKKTDIGTVTNDKGLYTIKAKVGTVIQFSHIGLKTKEILVEDITSILNIEMKKAKNMLREINITAARRRTLSKNERLSRMGYNVSYVSGARLDPSSYSLSYALIGKIPGITLGTDESGRQTLFIRNSRKPVLWDIDGLQTSNPPQIQISHILDIVVIKSIAGLTTYGPEASGGVVLITTKSASTVRDVYSKENPYTNKEYYKEDAISYQNSISEGSNYLIPLTSQATASGAYDMYKKISPTYQNNSTFYLDAAELFLDKYSSKEYADTVFKDLEKQIPDNAEILKAIAYIYQSRNLHTEALKTYKNIIHLRPDHAQSFRDIANTYSDLNQYKQAWRTYIYYLSRGYKFENNNIGDIMYREMEMLYNTKKDSMNLKESFVTKSDSFYIAKPDIRLVFEWNTSEAEFILEFVNPQKQSFYIEHSLDKDNALILDEKIKGYFSKEFNIEKITEDDWLINIEYLGNKKYESTYLKLTIYSNWGKENQQEDIRLFKLNKEGVKFQLAKLNKSYTSKDE